MGAGNWPFCCVTGAEDDNSEGVGVLGCRKVGGGLEFAGMIRAGGALRAVAVTVFCEDF